MLEYLDQLIEERKWEEALAYAEQLLSQVEDDPKTLLRVNIGILVSRHELGEFNGAQSIGQLCLKMVQELEMGECLGTVCLYLGTAYDRIGQSDLAMDTWSDFLRQTRQYPSDPFVEALVRYNMGIVHARRGELADAIVALSHALDTAQKHGHDRLAHGIRHAMIEAYIKLGNRLEVLRLLAQSLHYIRHLETNPGEYEVSRLWHFVLRSEFALLSGRYVRAEKVARKGLILAGDDYRMCIPLHMLLARTSEAQGNIAEAIDHALAARMDAIACRRYDLELEAADYMYQLITDGHSSI